MIGFICNSKNISWGIRYKSESPCFQYKIHETIREIADVWDGFLPENHALKSNNLLILEQAPPDDMLFRYVLAYKMGKLSGVIYLQEIKFSAKYYDHSAFNANAFLQLIRPCIINQAAHLLVCGNLFRVHFPGFYFSENIPSENIGYILNDYAHTRKSEKSFAGIFVKDSPHCLNLQQTSPLIFKLFPDDLTMEMSINPAWKSIDDYAQNLSKKYRQRFKKIQQSAESIVRKELDKTAISHHTLQLFELYMQVVERQSVRIGIINPSYFLEMKQRMEDSFKVVGYFQENSLIAFSSYIFYPDQKLEIHYVGLDYSQNEIHQLYFNILFDGLNLGIAHRQQSIELGRTARLAKASMGGKPVLLHSYYTMKLGIPTIILGILLYFFGNKMGEDWKSRNPLSN